MLQALIYVYQKMCFGAKAVFCIGSISLIGSFVGFNCHIMKAIPYYIYCCCVGLEDGVRGAHEAGGDTTTVRWRGGRGQGRGEFRGQRGGCGLWVAPKTIWFAIYLFF